jgi:sulfur relay (sulfurtransferase) DsrF/TusC family protein
MGKHVAVAIRRTPFNSEQNSEALRMAVGLTTGDHRVSVVFLEDGVLMLNRLQPGLIVADDVGKHLEACRMLGIRLLADEEALRRRGVDQPAGGVETLPFEELCHVLMGADVVIPF